MTAALRAYFHPLQALGLLARLFLKALAAFHALLFIAILLACGFLARCNPPVTSLMAYRAFTTGGRAQPVRFVPIQRIPRSVQLMFIRLEDYKFYTHAGIDPAAVRRAYLVNKAIGRTLYGGSTIPQQLARSLFLTPRKNYFRKYTEALIALEIDLFLSKERILELYVNYIEWGDGIYGIGAASRAAYGRPPAELSLDEFRRLVAVLPNPLKYDTNTFFKSKQMAARYAYLVDRFPDPSVAPQPSVASQPQAALLPAPSRETGAQTQ